MIILENEETSKSKLCETSEQKSRKKLNAEKDENLTKTPKNWL